jgi:hypothetical protein
VGLTLLALALIFGDRLRVARRAAPLCRAPLLIGLLVPPRNVKAYGCFEPTLQPDRVDCVQRSFSDGWDQAITNGCLRETAYYCIKVGDHLVSSNQDQVVKQLVLDHLVHSYNSLQDPNFLEYGYIKVYAEVADMLARRLPNQELRMLYVGAAGTRCHGTSRRRIRMRTRRSWRSTLE